MRLAAKFTNLPRAFFDPKIQTDNSEIILSEQRSHHLSNVLRLAIGDSCILINPESGSYFEANISAVGKKISLTRACQDIHPEKDNSPVLKLLIALCKGDKNERITDWATELGVSEVLFFQADRSVVKVKDQKEQDKKQDRLSTIAEAAALQCGRTTIPKLIVTNSLSELIKNRAELGNSKLICSLKPDALEISDTLQNTAGPICLAIGPEGDFSDLEDKLLRDLEFKPITLGPQVLRSELAVVSAISSIWHVTRHALPNL